MAEIVAKNADAAAAKCIEKCIDKVIKELPYMCCYKSYAVDFERKKQDLSAAVESVEMKIKEAKTRNETQIDPIVNHWVQKANNFIQQETTPKKWFSRYSLAKELERMTGEIPTMMEKASNFSHVAHAAERPGMKFYSQEFMHFKSRNSVFEQFMEELKDGNKWRIGLQAMGGSGKTTMAKAVGKELENSKAFDKVIFIEVPNPVDEKKIRDEIEKKLDLKIDDDKKKNLTDAEQIWIGIANAGKVLIILDDVWKELNLENIGIHHGIHTEGRCCVLLTTRYETVCKGMKCQKTINLEVLPEEDAVDLFLHHACESGNDCTYKSKLLASKIVNDCGRLPVIIVAVAKTFRNWAPNEWEDALAATETNSSLRHGNTDEEANKFYNSLKRSFECLDPRAQDLILLCSIFPRAYEIPVELLSWIAIGLGLCGKVDSYYKARSQVLSIKNKLVSSALLLPAGEGFVKMHDVIRDVAQHIADEKIQVIMDSKAKFEENAKYSSGMIDDFSNYFEAKNLEVLLVWVNANASLEVPNAFFRGMKGLRVLLLCSKFKFGRTLASSLPKSIHSLENIQTLSLTNWELGDISILQNLKELQSLALTNCSIVELPNDVSQLEKLRLLGLVCCSIKKNNPFEVIGRCLKLEVLYYVLNYDSLNSNAKPSKIIDLQEFGIYHIEGSSSKRSFQLDASTKRYFNSTRLNEILSESTVKSLVARAEILELTKCNETRWTNLIPDMVYSKEDGGMNDLIRLSLKSCPEMQCLIYTNGIPSDAAIFSNLVELRLHDMPVRELCRGDFPIDFLKQLEKLNLSDCHRLDGALFKGKLELSNLKSVKLMDCSMTCLFDLSTAQSLRQLENLYIRRCSKLKCLIRDDKRAEQKVDDHQDSNQKNHHSMFLKLKFLKVQECHELEFILPISPCKELESVEIDYCNELNYIFGQCPNEGGLYQMEKETILPLLQKIEIANVPKFINIYPQYHLSQPSQVQKSWGPMCCFSSKESALNIGEQLFSKANQLDHTQASKEKHLNIVGGLLTPPLYPFKNLRKMTIKGFPELKSLLTLSIASSLKLMETLEVSECGTLEHIITYERPNSHGDMNVHSIFPKLQQVYVLKCNNLEYVFPAFYSKDFKDLEVVSIRKAKRIKYVFGKCRVDQDHNVQSKLNFPALKGLHLNDVQNMVSICAENYYVEVLHLEQISCGGCPQSCTDFLLGGHKRQDLSRRKALSFKERGKPLSNSQELCDSRDIYVEPKNFLSFQNLSWLRFEGCKQLQFVLSASTARSMPKLRDLTILDCEELVSIIEDDEQNQQNPFDPHQSCLPELRIIQVKQCKKLKCLFSISTCPKLPRLLILEIEDAPELVQVFEWKQGAPQELVIKDVLPDLLGIRLVNLPSLHTIYQGIDLQTLKVRLVHDCGDIPSANVSSSELFDFLASLRLDQMNFARNDYYLTYDIISLWAIHQRKREEESEKALERDKTISEQNNSTLNLEDSEEASKEADEKVSTIQKQESSLPNLMEVEEEGSQEDIGNNASPNFEKSKEVSKDIAKNDSTTHKQDRNLSNLAKIGEDGSQQDIVNYSTMPQQNNGSPKFENSEEVSKEITEEDSTTNSNLTKSTKTSANEIVEEKLSTSISYDLDMNLKATFGKGPSSEKCGKASSSKLCGKESMDDDQQAHGESRRSNEAPQQIEEPTKEWFSKKTSNEASMKIPPPSVTEMTSTLDPSIFTLKKPLTAISTTHTEPKSSQSDMFDISINTECPQTNDKTCTDEEQMKFDQKLSSQIFEEHDVMRLFQMMKEGADMEVDLSYVSKLIADLHHNKEVTKALADLEASLKKGLNEIACSEESRLQLQNALNMLSSHCSEDGASSHGLQDTIQSLQEEIQTVLSSFNQAYATIDTFTKLEQREKLMIEQRSQREKDAKTLLHDISTTKNSIAEVQLNEAELKEQISKLQAELRSKEQEIEEYERKLLSLQEQEKKSVSNTIEFTMEFLAMEKERSRMVEDQMKARQQLENMDAKWSSCLSNLKKTMMLLGVHLKQKL